MRSTTTSRAPLLGTAAALVCLFALTGCGGTDGGSGTAATPTVSATPSVTPEPSGSPGAAEYGIDHPSVTVAAGKEFSLVVPSAATLGQNWYLADPHPDAAVLTYLGKRESGSDSNSDVAGATTGTQSFRFTALAPGSTTVRLLYCPLHTCTGPGPDDRSTLAPSPAGRAATPSPYPTLTARPRAQAGYYLFTVTVR
ncbi:protease inhibitor I42 family protein [Streptomyces sp. NPDC048106]|uniref:protease inhibitor I42 family protein n=1 Tax=Streptomyces sp. NPDC048106 TaxID=3155750 RepID=UPI0034531B2A